MVEQPVDIPVRKSFSPGELFLPVLRQWYAFKARYRNFRISAGTTRMLGPQYRRSRERIEIDITYVCNLRCLNCNRSISQAPEKLHISLSRIRQFVDESIARGKRWKGIRVLGGEPTLHPEFLPITEELLRYHQWDPDCIITVVSNGYGKAVNEMLKKIPSSIQVENTSKTGNLQPSFGAFNVAPVDDPRFANADFRNGCDIMENCGMGLTPLGYYPCAVAGGIDRIAGKNLGSAALPADDDDMLSAASELCRLCGHFRDGHCAPPEMRPILLKQEMSPTWTAMFDSRKSIRLARRHTADQAQEAEAQIE
jgi:hypothetical protein